MAMGGDSTLSGQTFFLSIKKGICSESTTGGCTVWGGNISIQHTDGSKASPSSGGYPLVRSWEWN